jgi:hypothetical protein
VKFEISEDIQKILDKKYKQFFLKFGPKNGQNLNEKLLKFEQILKFSKTKLYHRNIFKCRLFMADEMQQNIVD